MNISIESVRSIIRWYIWDVSLLDKVGWMDGWMDGLVDRHSHGCIGEKMAVWTLVYNVDNAYVFNV